jgi:hypothetical protein
MVFPLQHKMWLRPCRSKPPSQIDVSFQACQNQACWKTPQLYHQRKTRWLNLVQASLHIYASFADLTIQRSLAPENKLGGFQIHIHNLVCPCWKRLSSPGRCRGVNLTGKILPQHSVDSFARASESSKSLRLSVSISSCPRIIAPSKD